MSLDKRGGVGVHEVLEFIPYIFLAVIVLTGVNLLTGLYTNMKTDPRLVQYEVEFYRLLYQPGSILAGDGTDSTPGIINLSRFNDETIDKAIKYSKERHIAARLEIEDEQGKLVARAYHNKVWFERLEPAVALRGPSGAGFEEKIVPVNYLSEGVVWNGYLKIKMVVPGREI